MTNKLHIIINTLRPSNLISMMYTLCKNHDFKHTYYVKHFINI